MTRRKSVCLKWTLVLVLVVFCPYVYSRPQEQSQAVVTSSSTLQIDKHVEDPIRYRYRYYNVSFNSRKPLLDDSFVYNSDISNRNITNHSIGIKVSNLLPTETHNITKNSNLVGHRLGRLIRHRLRNDAQNNSNRKNNNDHKSSTKLPIKRPEKAKEKNKPIIKKVTTKWTDNAKFEDLDFSYESTTSDENGFIKFPNIITLNKYSTESNDGQSEKLMDKRYPNNRYRPRPQYSEETQIYSNNVQIVDDYPFPSTRPPYVFNTPTPTPVITNVGYPQPWPQRPQQTIYQTVQNRPTTQKPIKTAKPTKGPYDYHNTFQNNFPQYDNFEVTTFQPTTTYTDKIVIRPEEYSGSPEDCPTIFLTLNNTFQGQGKEVCPDLNIAVNTNVINKNVVFESEEENDTSFTDAFGIPLADDSESEEIPQDYFNSAENQEEEHSESASVEASGLTNYNAANTAVSSEPAGFGSPSGALSVPSRPGKPSNNDDDSFGLSSILSFFKPALNAFAWLATINPLSFGLLSLLLAPLVLLVAGTSGVAALFAPWAFPYGREAPKVVHFYKPQWQWDDEYKAWELNSFPDRQWRPTLSRSNHSNGMRSSIRTTWFNRLKAFMKSATRMLKASQKSISMQNNRKNTRKKRETWTIRVK